MGPEQPTEQEIDSMNDAELDYQKERERMTTKEKLQEQFDIVNRCHKNILDIVEKLSHV